MFEHEEQQLSQMKKKLDERPLPTEQLSEAIQRGVTAAQFEVVKSRKRRKKALGLIIAAALLFLTFVTSIRVSPAFANAVASLPGMGKIVELIQFDKGLQAIIDNDYYQSIDASNTKDDITLTIKGAILDESGMILSYTLEAPYKINDVRYKDIQLLHNGKEIPASYSYDWPEQPHNNRKDDLLNYVFEETMLFDDQTFTLLLQLDNEKETTFSLPFTVPEKVKKGKVYALNETLEIEGQKITIEEITIFPLRVAVKVAFDETNTMDIYHFEDLRIEDENGEVWSSIENGFSARGEGDERTFYLQSNYFEQPKELYLKLNELQALPKDDNYLLVDLAEKSLLHQPSVGNFEVVDMDQHMIEVKFPDHGRPFNYFLFGKVINAEGEEVVTTGGGRSNYDGYEQASLYFEKPQVINPLKVHFYYFPNYIEGDVTIRLK